MIRRLRATAVGVWAALCVPWWLRGERLRRLLEPPGPTAAAGARDARRAVKVAHRAIRVLARLPRSPWRFTCLYRSVAECLVLERYGVPARLRIGVRDQVEGRVPIAAHAWVERPGPSADLPLEYTPFVVPTRAPHELAR